MFSPTFTTDSRSKHARLQSIDYHIRPHSKRKVAYFHHKEVGNFHFGMQHPMKPHRLTLTNDLVLNYRMHEKMSVFCPEKATDKDLVEFHEADYINFLKKVTPDNSNKFIDEFQKYNINEDCPVFEGLYDFCKIYAGASIAAANRLVAGGADICVNWSGGLHHAKRLEASGFCFVNDIVLATQYLLRYYPRILYIDIDVHHGDGVQEAFYNTDRVMTVSFHKYDKDNFFPGTGNLNEIGQGPGKFFCLNVPLKDGIDDDSYVSLFKEVIQDVNDRYHPSVVVFQSGADSLGKDRLGGFNLSIKAHGECLRFIKEWNLPLLVLGGGGYKIHNVARCWTYETSILLETELPTELPKNSKYFHFFAPDYSLHPNLIRRVDNFNTKSELSKLTQLVHEQLRFLDGAPSVQMQEIPGDSHEYLEESEDEIRDAREEHNIDESRATKILVPRSFKRLVIATQMRFTCFGEKIYLKLPNLSLTSIRSFQCPKEKNNNLSKLSLEPRIGTAPIDVNEQGIEISQPNLESTEKLARQMQKVWGERQFRNLTIESLEASEEDTKKTKVKKEEKSKKAVSDLELMKDTIKTSIVQSYSEINVGIDVLNLILSETRQNFVPTNPLPIPAGIIQHKYHSYTQPNTISQIQNTKLMLGMKRK
ncbi:2001_t:CDS:2, partial [Entrophospora sp. SA101]